MNNRKGMIGLTLAVIMVASIFSVLPVTAQPPTPTEGDNPIINVNASGITASLRVYGEYDEGPVSWMGCDRSQFIYRNWSDPFDPTALKKDSLTFNPALIRDEYGICLLYTSDAADEEDKRGDREKRGEPDV